jgi:serine/threonine protein kinase
MKPEDAQRDRKALEIFGRALEIPAEARARCLEGACGGDETLKARVEALLANHVEDTILQKPAAAFGSPSAQGMPMTEQPGDQIGRYKLLEKLGEGGFGVVYMAEQREPVKRRVALKIIKVGMDTHEVVARFEAERQALALMDHPNIAKVHDGGATDTGRPYFVMELVRGIRITDYCDQNQLGLEERLKLFMQVCHAVQHAHQKGIIHRDLKPSNILVTLHDGVPVPKVIDFGIAKATQQELTEKTLFTQFHQFIGTPSYMSPEQAELSGLDIDTRSDIYSLGVLLYELLAGKPPFDGQELLKAGLDEMRRTLREVEPPRPSTRLAQWLRTAKRRNGENEKGGNEVGLESASSLNSQLKSLSTDLDWIVMKCLEKDRNRRYETANGLAADLQRHLSNEPVTARPPRAAYRVQKMIRRHRAAFTTAAAVLFALVAGLTLATWAFVREQSARRQAGIEAAKSRQVAKVLKDMIRSVEPSVAMDRDTTLLREITDQTFQQMDRDKSVPPEVEVELRATLGGVYHHLGDVKKAEALHRETLPRMKSLLGEDHPEVAALLRDFACVLEDRKKRPEAEAAAREALRISRRRHGPEHPDVAESLQLIARALDGQKRFIEAEATHRESLAMLRRLRGAEHDDVAFGLIWLAKSFERQAKVPDAEATFQEALAIMQRLHGDPHINVAHALGAYVDFLVNHPKPSEEEAVLRELLPLQKKMLGPAHPRVATTLNNLGATLHNLSRFVEAEPYLREALDLRRKLHGPEHADVAHTLFNLGLTLERLARLPEAEATLRDALAIRRKLVPANRPELEITLLQLGQVIENQGRPPEAEPLYRELLESRAGRLPAGHEDVIAITVSLARALTDGAWADRPSDAQSRSTRIEVIERARESERLLRRSLEARLQNPAVAPWKVSVLKCRLGGALVSAVAVDPALDAAGREARLAEAEALLLAGNQELQRNPAVEPAYQRVALEWITRLYTTWNKPAQLAEWRDRRQDFERMAADPASAIAREARP